MKSFFTLLLISTIIYAQNTPPEIIKKISAKYNKIKNIEMKVKIITDVPNFRMPIKTVKLFFIAPDSVRMETKGFAILPKNGALPFMYLNQLADKVEFDTSYTEMINGKEMLMITTSDTTIVRNGKLLFTLDNYLERIDKVDIVMEKEVVSTINFSYQNIDGFWMPDTTKFDFKMEKRIPYASAPSISNPFGSVDIGSKEDYFQNDGKVQLIFSDFKINN